MKNLLFVLLLFGCAPVPSVVEDVKEGQIINIHLKNMQQRNVEVHKGIVLPNSPVFTLDAQHRLVSANPLKSVFFSCELIKEFISYEKRFYLIRILEPRYMADLYFIEPENVIIE